MNSNNVTERTISIYLQVAETARFANDHILSDSMLLAAYDQVTGFSQPADQKTLIKLAELLVINKLTRQAEKIFDFALKNRSNYSNDSWLRARIYDGLAEVYSRQSEFEKARKKCEQAIRIIAKSTGLDPTVLSSRKRKLALIHMHQGNNGKAHELFREAELSQLD